MQSESLKRDKRKASSGSLQRLGTVPQSLSRYGTTQSRSSSQSPSKPQSANQSQSKSRTVAQSSPRSAQSLARGGGTSQPRYGTTVPQSLRSKNKNRKSSSSDQKEVHLVQTDDPGKALLNTNIAVETDTMDPATLNDVTDTDRIKEYVTQISDIFTNSSKVLDDEEKYVCEEIFKFIDVRLNSKVEIKLDTYVAIEQLYDTIYKRCNKKFSSPNF